MQLILAPDSSKKAGQKTTLHQITAKINVAMKLKDKKKAAPKSGSTTLSDEDDTLEQEAALSSPVKGMVTREASNVSNKWFTSTIASN